MQIIIIVAGAIPCVLWPSCALSTHAVTSWSDTSVLRYSAAQVFKQLELSDQDGLTMIEIVIVIVDWMM